MTKISQYPTLSNPTEDDILIGTDVNSSDETKNFSIGSIVNLVENGGRPYKVYTALLTQEGEDAPVAAILENTLGYIPLITKDLVSIGVYYIELNSLTNTFAIISSTDVSCNFEIYKFNSTKYRISTTIDGNASDDILNNTPVEIRVYN
jgi:hypothetical protein